MMIELELELVLGGFWFGRDEVLSFDVLWEAERSYY